MQNFQPPAFESAAWLPNGHFQTVFASLVMPVSMPHYRREILDLPDGDIIAADWIDGDAEKPLLVLIHGMEGSSQSRYARLLMNGCLANGWRGVVLHMRSCGGLINRRKNFYHAGFYQDIEFFLDTWLPEHFSDQHVFLAGVSLGGSQVIHYLAKGQAAQRITAAAIVSTPLDLGASADFMSQGLSQTYVVKFRNSLLEKYYLKSSLIQDDKIAENLASARTFWDLDNAATAPLHGFRNAEHYYLEMSAKNCLQDIQVPTLYMASKDDPFIPVASLPNGSSGNANLTSLLTEKGGHVGFVNHYGRSWMLPTVFNYFNTHVA